jgi:hypothetical protein
LGARAAYREKHKLSSPSSGEIIPTFDEEVEARSMATLVLGLSNSRGGSYWDAIAKVGGAGFLKEYVWTYFRRPNWPAKQVPKNLAAFEKWRSINLRNHKPETRGKLMAK